MAKLTASQLRQAHRDHQYATGLRLGGLAGYLAIAAFFGLTMGTAALGAIYPDITVAIADPIICDGELHRTSERFAYDKPGETTITHEFFCHERDGRVTAITGKTFGAAALMWTLGIFMLVTLRRTVAVLRNRLLLNGNATAAKTLVIAIMAACALAAGLLGWRELSAGLGDESPAPHRVVAGILSLWVSLLFWRMLFRRSLTERASSPPMMRLRAIANLPFGLGAAFGPAVAGFWYGMMSQDFNDVASMVLGGLAALVGLLPANLTLRFVFNPKAYATWLEDAAASRQRHRAAMMTFGATGELPDNAETPKEKVLARLSQARRRNTPERHAAPREGMSQQLAEIAQAQKLRASGALSDEEFAAIKARILGRS